MHPSEAARQERLEDRPGLIEACDPTVPIDERWAVGFLQSRSTALLRGDRYPGVPREAGAARAAGRPGRAGRFPPGDRQLSKGRFGINRAATEPWVRANLQP